MNAPRPTLALAIVRMAAHLVPRRLRHEWVREWQGELLLHPINRPSASTLLVRRSLGSLVDAAAIRCHEWSPDMLLQDVRFAFRTLARSRGFAAVVVGVLALGIGINSALFSVVDATLLAPLPFPDSERLVRIYGYSHRLERTGNQNPMDAVDLLERSNSLDSLSYTWGRGAVLGGLEDPIRVRIEAVSASYFDVLQVTPRGRGFRADEGAEGQDHVVVISHDTWQRLFGGDEGIIGRTVLLSDESYEVVGIAPPRFQGAFGRADVDFWAPVVADPENRGGHFALVIARLKPGMPLETASEEIVSAYTTIAEEFDKPDRGVVVMSLRESLVGNVRPMLLVLLAAVGLVLLIACANVANLMLARAVDRTHEMAVRRALGAASGRLARQLFTESATLALAGGLLGVLVAAALLRLATTAGPLAAMPPMFEVGLNERVLLFSMLVSIAAGLLFGFAPVLHAAACQPAEVLREARAGSRLVRSLFRRALVVAEVTVSVVLLVGALLALRSFYNLANVNPGFDPDGLLSLSVAFTGEDTDESRNSVLAAYDRLLERLRARPDVRSVGLVNRLPLTGSYSCDLFILEGWPDPEPEARQCIDERVVGGDYFQTMGIRLLEGRLLTPADSADAEQVVVVSRAAVEQFMPGENPIGRGFKWGFNDERPFRRIVGVVDDVRHFGLDAEARPEVYMPQAQYPFYSTLVLVARVDGDPLALVPEVRALLREIAPSVPIYDIATMNDRLAGSVRGARQLAWALVAFALLAVTLACIGLYGVLAYMVSGRQHEIGVRMALGARGGDVVMLVVRQGLGVTFAGLVLGTAVAAAVAGSMRGLLHGIEPLDPLTFAAVPVLLGAVAAVASLLPAWRAARVDPLRSLRAD